MVSAIIPQNFNEWQSCIVKDCGIPLTVEFIDERLAALANLNNEHTRQFIKCYGEAHYQQTVKWFEQVKGQLA